MGQVGNGSILWFEEDHKRLMRVPDKLSRRLEWTPGDGKVRYWGLKPGECSPNGRHLSPTVVALTIDY